MTDNEKRLFLEYMMSKHDSLSYDLKIIRSRINFYRATSDDMYDLIVADVRVDTASNIFRELRELLLLK